MNVWQWLGWMFGLAGFAVLVVVFRTPTMNGLTLVFAITALIATIVLARRARQGKEHP